MNHGQGKLPVFLQNLLKNESFHVYNTRKIKDYNINRNNRRLGERMLLNKGARLWNELPQPLNIVNFKRCLKRYFITRY